MQDKMGDLFEYRPEGFSFGKIERTSFHTHHSAWRFVECLQPSGAGRIEYGYD
jgi:hypothetical protein